jgi:hypothetical protein
LRPLSVTRRAIPADDHPVRRRIRPERDLLDGTGRRIEAAERPLLLSRIPHWATGLRTRGHVVRPATGRQSVRLDGNFGADGCR